MRAGSNGISPISGARSSATPSKYASAPCFIYSAPASLTISRYASTFSVETSTTNPSTYHPTALVEGGAREMERSLTLAKIPFLRGSNA